MDPKRPSTGPKSSKDGRARTGVRTPSAPIGERLRSGSFEQSELGERRHPIVEADFLGDLPADHL
jgi:hypothetical protein